MQTNRKKLPKSEEKFLSLYFGRRCIITGSPDFDWHHLDDDPRNTVAENIVPLGARLNTHLRDVNLIATKGGRPVLRAEVDPDSLERRADLLFCQWDLGRGYGCARLAYYIASRYLKVIPDRSLHYACKALYFTRHRLNYRFMLDVLNRNIIPSLQKTRNLSSNSAFRLVRELAGIYSEHGQASNARELYEALDAERVADSLSYAGFLRRKATAMASDGTAHPKVDAMLMEALKIAAGNENLTISVVNSQAWILMAEQKFGQALQLIEPIVKRYNKIVFPPGSQPRPVSVTIWNVAELFHNYAVALTGAHPSGFRVRRAQALEDAWKLFTQGGAVPYDFRKGFSADCIRSLCKETGLLRTSKLVRRSLPSEVDSAITQAARLVRHLW